ncbi:hypothetical protein BC629DRAFT_1586804 [Irpex lacteus]|nr:hypothetical protein BC629DRAFT_1586804 [Irpex lacteus]
MRKCQETSPRHYNLAAALIHDGTSDFLIFLFFNVLELLSNLPAFPSLNSATPLLRVSVAIPPITTYRFILKVRSWVTKKDPVSPEGDSGDLAFSQHAEEAGEEDYHLQVRPYPVQQDHVSTYGAGNEEYGRPDFESQFELGEMKRVLNQSLEAHRQMTSNEDVDECEENNFDGPLRLSEVQGCTPSQTEEFVVGHDIGAPDNV